MNGQTAARRYVSLAIGFIVVSGVVAAQEYDLSWYTVDGGGVMRSASADRVYELSGTIGQPDAGAMSAPGYQLTGGFWFQIPPTDCDEDGTVSLYDYDVFHGCVSGPDAPYISGCFCFDVDRDGDADLNDFAVMQSGFTGP